MEGTREPADRLFMIGLHEGINDYSIKKTNRPDRILTKKPDIEEDLDYSLLTTAPPEVQDLGNKWDLCSQ